MNDLTICPVCNRKLIIDSNSKLEDVYECFNDLGHAFAYFPNEKKFGLVIRINNDELAAGSDNIYINKAIFLPPDNYNINNCYEVLMGFYKRVLNNRAFS